MGEVDSLRFDDVVTFLTVHRARSISAAARKLGVTPSQVSKAVVRIEDFVGAPLLARGSRGVTVTMAGLGAIPMLEEIARGVRDLRRRADALPTVRVAAPSSLLSSAAGVLARLGRTTRYTCLELDPTRTRALAFDDAFDIALLGDVHPLGEPYTHERIGEVESCLLARPSLANRLGTRPVAPEVLERVPFVMPLLVHDARISRGRDLCPLPFELRTHGHAAATFGVALELAMSSDHLVFGPRIAARGPLARRDLVEIAVEGWSVRWPVYLACHATRVRAKTARAIGAALTRWLDDSA